MYANNAGIFLVQTLFGLYILAVLLRFLLQWVRADFYNPIVQFLVRITNPPLVPLRRVIPGLMGLDLAAGRLGVGDPADVCVFDPSARWTVRPEALHSRGRNTPFSGRELPGRVSHTVLAGRIVHESD